MNAYAEAARAAGLGASEAPLIGGGSDASTSGAMGIASIDGLGPRGKGFHTVDEQIEAITSSVRTRRRHIRSPHLLRRTSRRRGSSRTRACRRRCRGRRRTSRRRSRTWWVCSRSRRRAARRSRCRRCTQRARVRRRGRGRAERSSTERRRRSEQEQLRRSGSKATIRAFAGQPHAIQWRVTLAAPSSRADRHARSWTSRSVRCPRRAELASARA